MAERPLYTLYKNLKAQNYDVPDDYNKFESALTRDGKGGADNRHAIYENLKAQNYDVPDTYERFYSALFEPRSKTSSRAKGGSVPMSAADRARFSAGAAAISASAQQTMNNAGRYNRLKQRKQKQQKDFGRVNLGTHQTAFGGDANNVVKDDFAYNPETGKAGAYVTSDNENVYSQSDAEQKQAILDEQNNAYQQAVDTGEIPSAFDVRDKNGNYDLQENIGKNGTYLTEEGAQNQFDKKLADAYARKKEIETLIAEDNRQHGNPLLSYSASIGANNGRTAEQSDYRNKLATSLSLVTEQIGALEAVKQYPTSSWGEDALKALDNTAFTAKTWDFGLTDFAIMGQMERIKTKMDNNIPLSGSDKMLLKSKLGADAATALEDEKMGNVYRWTKIAGQSLPFMADFFLTGGYGGITKGISRGALKFAAKRGMGKVGAAILKNTGIVAGDVIGSYAMAGTEQALKTGADIMQRHLGNLYQDEKGDYKFGTFDENGNLLHEGGESMGTALYKGMTSAMVENYTEKLFGHNYGIKKGAVNFMEKHGMNASAEFFKNIGKSGWYTNSKKWMEKFGVNGFAEEVMEEEIGIPLHALLDGEGKVSDLLDTKQQLDIIGGMAISVGSMYAMGAGSRPVKGIYNRAQYYRFRNKVNVADSDAENLLGDNWADIKDKIDNATNEQMGSVLAGILRQRDTMTKEQINAAVNYGVNLMKMRGYNIAKTAEMNAREITNEPTTPEEQHQADIDNAYSEGHDADDADKHDIQIQQEDQMKTLAAALGISEQQLSAMSDEELESLTGQDDKLDQAIYDYQLSSARYQGVVDDAQDKVDLAAHQAEQRVDMYTDQSRGSVRNATIKASGGLEDYGVYIISGNIATHEDGSIDVSNSDDMILYYDPTTNSVEHADAMMFAELGEELPADDVKTQAVADAKENAIKEIAGIIDGTVEVGFQFNVTDADGTEHTYEVLADYGDGTAAISIDGNVAENPYSLADLQQMKDLEDQKRLEAAKAEREQMEKERAAQQTQETEETQPSFDFNQILNDDGNVVLVDVLDEDGNTKYPDSKLFLIRDTGAKAKVVELKSDGTIVPHAVNKEDVATISSMSLDEYKQAMPESSMIEDNSGEEYDEDSQLANLGLPKGSEIWMSGDGFGRPKENTLSRVVGIDEQGSIILEDKDGKTWSASFDYINNHRELPPLDENTNIVNEENNQSESNTEENAPAPEQTPAMTLEDGTIVPMLEDGNPDFSKLTAEQTAELYDTQFGEDADSVISNWVSEAKKALDKANNMAVKGKTFVEQKAAKDAKEKAIAEAQAAYDSAIAIRDAYNERQLAKVEDTAEGRKNLIDKARRKFARLKSAVKDDAEAVSQLYRETIGSLLHRLYDGTGIDVTDTTPLTAEEYVASNLGAHSLNYEGTETSKGVKQETGLSREDFAKTQLLAADGKGTTIDALVHSLWENRPSNLESLDTQDIRNALIGVLNSGFKASEARNFVENIRIAQAENILEEQKRAQENAAYAEQQKAEQEAELKAKSDEKSELKAKSEAKLDNESSNESNDLDNETDNEKINDNINDNINVPEDATDDAPLGEQRDESDLPFSAKENGTQQTTAERAADVEKNKVDDVKVVDNIVGQKTRKAFERLAKMMGASIQWQYSDKLGNGWIQETTDADGNVHRTIFITLDSSITEGAQFIFGHEMTHQIKNLNPAAYNELTQLVLDTYGSDAFDKAVDETMQRYSDAGFSGRAREYYAEEVVADALGEMIRDLNLAHTLAMKMSHPLLAAIHEILQKIKLAFYGTEYSDVTKNIIRSIEQAYVKTANGQVTNSETGEDVSFSLRQKPEPKKKVNRILTREEQAELVKKAGREPQQIQEGDIITDDVVNSINQEIAAAPKFSLKDIKPVGKNQFGDVYDQFKGKPKEAFDFLLENKDGYLKGVFHRDEIGDIDLAYGSAPNPYKGKGLAHIIRKHVETLHDFPSVDDAINTITDVISNGVVKDGSIPNTYDIENGDYRVVVAADNNGNWVLTAFDYVNPTKKKKKGTATALPPSQSSDGAGAVAPNLSAAKIDNSSETAKENGEKFSLKDEKTLAGVHNITEEKLRKALKLGGFANPSLAVIDTNKTGHDNFGEISFIAPSALVDKRTGKTAGTWITDAYTQRYPSVEREMSEKGYRKFEDWVDSLDYPSGAKAEIERQAKDALSDNNAPAWELMYLKEKGIDIKEYDSRIDYRWKEIISDHPTAEDILNSMKTDPELNEKVTSLAKHAIIHPTWEKVSLEVRRKMYKETGVKASPINPQVRKQTKEIFERDYAPTLLNKDGSPRKKDVKKVVGDIVKEHNDTKKYDFYLSKVKASNYVNKNGLYDDYIRWQENKLDEFGTKNRIFRGYTKDGSRKYVPETLENVSKAMREEADGQTNGSEYTSFGSFIAKLASRVDSTDEMRANKDKLSSNKDKEEFYEKWNGVYYDLAKFLYNDVFYGEQRLHDIILQSDPKKYAKKEYGITLTPTFMKKLDALKNAVQTELKSAYFETKYNRPLRLNEFAAAVVPDNLGEDVRKGIENAGLPMYDYDPNKEGDRSRAFNEAVNSSDNIRFSLAGERGATAADKAEERTFRMDNLSVARKMEEEKKDAKAIKMATGWERGADGKWRYEMPDAKIKDTMDVGGGHIVKRYEDDMLWNGGKLSKVIDAPELFKAYPQLKDVRIETDAIMNDMPSNGEYNSKTNTITIHADELKYMNDILNHEIQHAIQDIEGFAKGGSPRLIRGEVKKKLNEVTKQIRQLRAEGKEDEAKTLIEQNRGLYNAYQKNDDFNSYKSLAGEVEARNVQERMNMTSEERRKTLAESTEDVARKDQIFLGVGDVSFSLRDMADGKESGAADMAEDLKSLNTPDEVDDAIKTAIEDMPSGWQMANKKMIHVAQALGENRKAEIAGEEPKFSLKDGSLIKAGTYFSGGGLVEEGLKGIIDPVVAVEYDEKISGVYRNNFGQHIVTADVRDIDPKELVKQIDGEVEYFHASPVCKNYSQAKSNHAEVELDKETAASTAEFINAVKPKVVTIENVKGYKDSDAMKTITDALDTNGYTWDADVYNAADYGGYTNRERLIVRAVRDGKLPAKPKKMAHKSGWYEAVADIIPTLTEKKNGVAPWMDIRLKADGIDWRNIDKPLYVMGSAYADGKIPHAFADELLPTLRTKSGDVIVMPDGKVYRAMGRVLARVSGVSDDYKMPFSENLSHTIIGNGIPTQLTEHVIAPLLTGSDPKFSIRTYHGTGASFDKFDFSHMGEGEGSQAFGWGGYVTNSKDIAEDYTRRAKIRKDNGGFEFVTDMSANNKDMVSQYIYKHKDVNKGLDAMRKDISSALEMFPDDDDLKELSNILAKKNEEIAVPDNIAYLYDVDIPDDNGDYLDWDAPLTDKQKNTIIKELRRLKIDFADFKKRGFSFDGSFGGNAYDFLMYALRRTKKWKDVDASRAVSKFLSSIGFTGIKYKAGTIFGGAKEGDTNYVIFDENNANIVGNTRFSLRYDQFEHDLNQWKKDNNLSKDAQRPTIPQRNVGESAVDFLRRVDEYRKQMALWKTAPTYEQHLLSNDTALGEFNRELQRGSVLKRIAFQDSMLAIRKAQEAIMKEVGVDRLNMAEDAYTAENRSHGKGKNEFEEYNNEFLQPLRKAYHQMKKVLGDSYDNVRIYMMSKHGLERDAQMAFKKSLEADYEDVAQRSAAYKAYKGDMNRIINDSDLEFGRVDFTTWRQRDNALRVKYSPSYMNYRYDKMGIAYDYSGLSALFDGSDFEEAAHKLIKDIESKYVTETHDLWDATNAATKKILRDGYKAGMMSKDTYQYVRDMYSHYIPLRGWDGTTADQVWDYIGGGKGAFNQTLKKANGRTSIADDPIAYIENMAESGILLNNKNWVKQHLMLLAQNHPTSLLTLSKAWYVKSTDANGNEEWIPATPQITSQMNSNQVKAAIDAFEQKMEQMAQTGDATQKRDGLNIAYPQTNSEEREHEVRVMKDGEEYVIYVNGDPQLAQAMNNTRAHRVREIQSGKLDRAAAWLGRKMAAAYTSLSPLFIPSNYFRDLTMTLASTAIREDGRYNYLLRKNLATSWNLGFMLRDYQNGKLREKVSNGNATPKEQMFYDFMMNGGETGFVSSLDVEDLKKKFKNDLKDLDRWKTNPVKVGHTIMDGIEFLNRAIEDSNRFAVYMTSIQYGRSIDEAVNDAKDVTLNFNRKGTGEYGWQMIRNLYLFINPAVQSLQTLGALAKHHPFKFTAVTASWLASGVLVPIVNAALMSLLGGDDDKDKYWQFTKWDRRNNLIMWVPFTHEYIKIPLAQEFRAFYGIGDMIASKMMGGELAEESWSQYAEDLLGQVVDMLPLDPTGYDGNIAVSLMPNAIRPVFELAFNVDFTGKPLFKDTEYNKYDPNFTKAYVGTPDWLVRASKMVNSIGNDYPDVQQNSIDAFGDPRYNLNNPAVVDHVLSSYLGGAYTMGSQVLGVLTKSLNDPKEIKVADIPLFSKFVSNPDDRPVTKKQGDEFWNMKENHDRAANTLSKLKKQAKVDGDYSMLERFYGSEEYKQYKQDDVKVKKYEEDKKKERAEESGEEYRPHKLNAEDIYKAHATPKDDFEDLKLKQLYTKLNGFKSAYDLLVDTAPSQSDGYYNTNKAAIDAIDEISLDKQEISELKKGFLDDGKDAYNAEDMKQIRELRKKILSVLEKANKVVVANQKAKAEK